MRNRSMVASVVGAIAVLTLAAAPVRAQLVNNGLPNGVGGNEMTQWIQAEDFTLGGASILNSVRFWSLGATGSYQGSINWQIYSNSAGVPGSVLYFGLATPTTTAYPGAACCGFPEGLQLDFALPAIALGAGTYWLGLHNGPLSTTTRLDFYWATTNGNATGTGEEDIAPFGDVLASPWFNNANEHAFQLNATNVVPEPATMTLLATGLVGLVGAGRRRRKA